MFVVLVIKQLMITFEPITLSTSSKNYMKLYKKDGLGRADDLANSQSSTSTPSG